MRRETTRKVPGRYPVSRATAVATLMIGCRCTPHGAMPVSLLGCVGSGADVGAGFRHPGTTRTRSYDMVAAFMLLQVHGWGIHAVRTGRRARAAGRGGGPGAHEHHGPQPA